MSCTTQWKTRRSAKLAAGLAISVGLVVGMIAGPAHARWAGRNDQRGYAHGWNGGYYRAPPVVYGSPYGSSYYGSPYYAPPVVYGPGIGISLPGVFIQIPIR